MEKQTIIAKQFFKKHKYTTSINSSQMHSWAFMFIYIHTHKN